MSEILLRLGKPQLTNIQKGARDVDMFPRHRRPACRRWGYLLLLFLVLSSSACGTNDSPGTSLTPDELLGTSAEGLRDAPHELRGVSRGQAATNPADSKPLAQPEDSASETSTTEWTKVLQPRRFEFPRDHGVHPEYQIEWWYFTGNLVTPEGRRFGYQLTFFRTGIQREPTNPSRWTVRDLYTAHFAISDVQGKTLHMFERSNRAGIEWAGADEVPGRVWNGNWQWTLDGDEHHLRAERAGHAIDLKLHTDKPAATHDQQGLSRKGAQPGNASYYYSLTRLSTEGELTLDGITYPVTGLSWMDHEFSSSFLEKGQQGWDWFSIQLEDGHELMIYQIRATSGEPDPYSSGTIVAPDGSLTVLKVDDFQLTARRKWKSPHTDGQYPIEWGIRIPSRQVDLVIQATFPDQEMDTRESTGIIYWEGTIDVQGTWQGRDTRGRGYLEMTGYAESELGGLLEGG